MSDLTLPADSTIVTESATPKTGPDAEERERKKKLLALARKQLKSVISGENFYREQAAKDAKFRAGTWGMKSYQWPDGVQEEREADKRPCITVNRMPSFIRQVTNQARAAHLRIHVNPVDDMGDPKVAEVIQGIIRNIETQSFADRAYAMASDKQAEQGRGFLTLTTEWVHQNDDRATGPDLFRQRLRIKREINPLSIYVGYSEEADYGDADFSFKVSDVDAEKWKELTGKTEVPTPATAESLGAPGDETGDWFPSGKIRIAEWVNRESVGAKRRLALMDDGRVIPYPSDEQKAELEKLGAKILRDRWVQKRVMMKRLIDCCDVHEESEWVTDQQPHVPVLGDEYIIEGEKDYRGVVRDSQGAAQVYNVEVSALVENVGLGNKSPVVGYKGQFGLPDSPQRKAWETAHKKPYAFLELDPIDIDGKPAPFIGRQAFEPPIDGVVVAIQQADNDYKATAGFFDASLGERGPQESGKAIIARQRQDELGSSHYLDNLRFALCALGKQLVKAVRRVYDAPQTVRITGKDERPKKVMVFSGKDKDPRNPQFQPKDANGNPVPFQLPDGVKEIYDIGVGEYDVEVTAGPDTGSRRAEAVEAMTQLFATMPPEIAVKFLDLYFMVMDFPKAQQMAERAKMLLPPELQEDEESDIPPAVRAKMMAMKQQFEEVVGKLKEAEQALETDQVKAAAMLKGKQIDAASRERIAAGAQQTVLAKTEAEINADQALTDIQAQIENLRSVMTMVHEQRMARDQNRHDASHEVGLEMMRHATATAQADQQAERDAAVAAAAPTETGTA